MRRTVQLPHPVHHHLRVGGLRTRNTLDLGQRLTQQTVQPLTPGGLESRAKRSANIITTGKSGVTMPTAFVVDSSVPNTDHQPTNSRSTRAAP
eukprot:12848535-Alexandrium_andersonii.AAC.1